MLELKRIREELREEIGLAEQLRHLEKEDGPVTLVSSAKDERHNQAVALREFFQYHTLPGFP